MAAAQQTDVLVIGSGFGGSVAALRLAEKGYRVTVIEAGSRYRTEDFPKTNWNLRKSLYFPRFGLRGILRMDFFRGLTILSGAGVGGGSLVYANTLIQPSSKSFQTGGWPKGLGITDWEQELAPYYQTARRMLGVRSAPTDFVAEAKFRQTAERLGYGSTFQAVNVGVFMTNESGEVADPYFDGQGPRRRGCNFCGGCMTGCRFNAKNSLDKNYLYLAEALGARVVSDTEAVGIYKAPDGSYLVKTKRAGWGLGTKTWQAKKVVLAAGVLGTLRLLLRCRDDLKSLPDLSGRLGADIRTNSESLLGVRQGRGLEDFSHGLAITASVHPNEFTKIEAVRYGKGSNLLALLTVPLRENGRLWSRWWQTLRERLLHPITYHRFTTPKNWSEETAIILIMQSLDNRMRMRWQRWFGVGPGRLVSDYAEGRPPVLIPEGVRFAHTMAEQVDGFAGSSVMDLMGQSVTAHILGGCAMGDSQATGVIDHRHAVYGYPGLYVVGGAAIPANLGANPSLTITAMAERAMAHF